MPRGPRPSFSAPGSQPDPAEHQTSHDATDAPADEEPTPRRVVVGAAWSLPVLRTIAETDAEADDTPDEEARPADDGAAPEADEAGGTAPLG